MPEAATGIEPCLTWDRDEETEEEVAYLQDHDGLIEEVARQRVNDDHNLLDIRFDDMCAHLSELLAHLSPDSCEWKIDVINSGWQKSKGKKIITARDGRELLDKILPDTECTFKIFHHGDHLELRNSHHDAPTGDECYIIRPLDTK